MLNRGLLVLVFAALLAVLAGCGVREPASDQTTKVISLLDKDESVPDIAAFLQVGRNELVALDWNSSAVYFKSKMSGAYQIYRLSEDGWPYQLTTFDDGVDFFHLSHNGQLGLAGASVGGSEQSQLYLLDARTGRSIQLTYYDDIRFGGVKWSADDKYIFYYSNEENGTDMFIYRMDIATGESQKVFGDTSGVRGWNYLADISSDGNFAIIENGTSNVSNDLYLLNLETEEHQKLNEDEGNVEYLSMILMPDNKTIWMRCNGNDDGITRLAKMTVGSPVIEFIDDGWIDPRWELKDLGVSHDYKIMFALVNEDGYQRLKLRDMETMKEISQPPLDGMVTGVGIDKDHNVYFGFNGPTKALDIWRWNPGRKDLTQLTFALYAGVDPDLFRDPKLIRYKSFDGLEIPAFLYLPPDYKEGQTIPFILYAHGGPESQFQPRFYAFYQYLLLNGYGMLAPNPRGSSGYGREYRDMDNYKNRKKSLQDYKAAADWLIENGYTKPEILAIRGGSYGGYVTLGMITEYPDLFAAAVDVVGISNFRTFLTNTKDYRRKYRESEYGPLSDPEFLESISPNNKAHLIKTPLLVIHGANDPRVPLGEALQIISAVKKNGGIVDSLIFYDEGHGSGKLLNTIVEYTKQAEFLDRHLKGMTTDDN